MHHCVGICPEIAKALTHHVDKVNNFEYLLSQLCPILLHLHVLKHHAVKSEHCHTMFLSR